MMDDERSTREAGMVGRDRMYAVSEGVIGKGRETAQEASSG